MSAVEYKMIIPDRWHIQYAQQVSEWIAAAIKKEIPMLPKKPEAVLDLFNQGFSVIAVEPSTGEMAAHVCLYPYCKAPIVEVGGAIRNPRNEFSGAAAVATVWAIKRARELFPERRIIAVANPVGAKALIEKHGGKILSHDELPHEAFELCGTCPRIAYKTLRQKCCDQPIDLSNSHLE